MTLNVQFNTVAEAMAWMQRRHGMAKGIEAAASESVPDPKDRPVEPEEGDDEEEGKKPPPAPEAPPVEEPKPA